MSCHFLISTYLKCDVFVSIILIIIHSSLLSFLSSWHESWPTLRKTDGETLVCLWGDSGVVSTSSCNMHNLTAYRCRCPFWGGHSLPCLGLSDAAEGGSGWWHFLSAAEVATQLEMLWEDHTLHAPHLAVSRWQHLSVLTTLGWSIITIGMAEILKPIKALNTPTDLAFMLKPP